MNNETIRNQYDAFDRIKGFGLKHAGRFAAGSRALTLFTATGAVAAAMEEQGVQKISGTGEFHGGTDAKQVAAEEVREDLRAIRDTAEAISEGEGLPEFDDQFLMPRSAAYSVLVTKAKAFLKDATPHVALFIEFEMEADFLADLAADIAVLEAANDTQDTGLSDQVGGTAELTAIALKGIKLRMQLLPLVRNKFRKEPGILAEWETANHIVRVGRSAKAAPVVPA